MRFFIFVAIILSPYSSLIHAFESSQPSMHLVGNHNGWSTSATPMTLVADDTWSVTLPLDNSNQFKFVPVNWSLSYGDANQDGIADNSGGGNIGITSGAGNYTIVFNDRTLAYTKTLFVGPQPPIADAGTNQTIRPGETLTISATNSSDPDGTIESYIWSTGHTSPEFTQLFNTEGTFNFEVTITDNDGLSDSASIAITVENRPPESVYSSMHIAGSHNGWAYQNSPMTLVDDYTWSLSLELTSGGQLKFLPQNWSLSFGDRNTDGIADSAGGGNIQVPGETSEYLVTFNDQTLRYTFTENTGPKPPIANAGNDISARFGSRVSFDGSGSFDPDGEIVTFSWDNGIEGQSGELLYPTPGEFIVTLTVTDDQGLTDSNSINVTIEPNAAPIADAGQDIFVRPSTPFSLSASNSSDSDGTITTYEWSNGVNQSDQTLTIEELGTFTYEVTITDNDGAQSTDSVRVIVATNQAPVANAGNDIETQINSNFTLNASNSSDADGSIQSYEWSINKSGEQVTHSYSEPGVYEIMLTVTDSEGATDTDTLTVSVLDRPLAKNFPTMHIAGNHNGWNFASSPLTLIDDYTWQTQATLANGNQFKFVPESWALSFGDNDRNGIADSNGGGNIANNGNSADYIITFNDQTLAYSVVEFVGDRPPVADAGADISVRFNEKFTLNASSSSDPDGNIILYQWSTGDEGETVELSYAEPGQYTVTLTITDDQGLSDSDDINVNVVGNQHPTALLTDDQIIRPGQSALISAIDSFDSDGDIVSYLWSTNETAAQISVSPDIVGEYIYEVTVTDNDGASATLSTTITVAENQPPTVELQDEVNVFTNEQIILSAATANDPDGFIESYLWSSGEQTSSIELNITTAGEYSRSVIVTDNEGLTASDSIVITVEEKPLVGRFPTMHVAGNHNGWNFSSSPMTLIADNVWQIEQEISVGQDFKFVPESWALSFGDNDRNGIADSNGGGNIGIDNESGNYEITFNDTTLTYSVIFKPIPKPPVANAGGNQTTWAGNVITLSASESTDPDNDIESFLWSTGETTPEITLVYTQVGTYTETVTVTDTTGLSSTDDIVITIEPARGLNERVPFNHNFPLEGNSAGYDYKFEDVYPDLGDFSQITLILNDGVNNGLYFLEKHGMVKYIPSLNAQNESEVQTVLDIRSRVHNEHERGLIGFAFDPNYQSNSYVYAFFTEANSQFSTVARYDLSADNPLSTELKLLWQAQPGSVHKGGMLAFDANGDLFISIGDGESNNNPRDKNTGQNLNTLLAKILRITPTETGYDIPTDNPFYGDTTKKQEIYAYGLRNPWRFSIDPATQAMWAGDVGQNTWEEINLINLGGNYGWPQCEGAHNFASSTGSCTNLNAIDPVHEYGVNSAAKSVTGGYVYRGRKYADLNGQYVFGDYVTGNVWTINSDNPTATKTQIAQFPGRLSTFGLDSQGEIYGATYSESTGKSRIFTLKYLPYAEGFPQQLSATGLFSDTATLQAVDGLIPYDVIQPYWMDGATTQRWIGLPNNETIDFSSTLNWDFPIGTVIVKHLEMPINNSGEKRRLETAILLRQTAQWAAFTYKWNAAQTDATLITQSTTEEINAFVNGELRSLNWQYRATGDCLACHTNEANVVRGLNTNQLNSDYVYPLETENQLSAWNHIGLFSSDIGNVSSLSKFANISDESANETDRVLSYLDVNCSGCHQSSADMDYRFDTAMEDRNIIHSPTSIGSAKLVPFSAITSGIYLRQAAEAGYRMPRGTSIPDQAALTVLEQWINGDNATLNSVSIISSKLRMDINETLSLETIGTYSNTLSSTIVDPVTWTASDSSIFAIYSNAPSIELTPAGTGTAEISVTLSNGMSDLISVTVFDGSEVESIAAVPPSLRVSANAPGKFVVTATTGSGDIINVSDLATFTITTGTEFVSLDDVNTVTGIAYGEATLLIEYAGQQTTMDVRSDGAGVTVYAVNSPWNPTRIHAWNDNARFIFGNWPGSSMQQEGDYYVAHIPSDKLDDNGGSNLLFNGNGQTGNKYRDKLGWYNFTTNSWSDTDPAATENSFSLILFNATQSTSTVDSFAPGNLVDVSADIDANGRIFSHWSGSGTAYIVGDSTASNVSLVMPNENISLSANYTLPYDPEGKILYEEKCANCHGLNGEGGIGISLLSQEACPVCNETDLVNAIASQMPPAPSFDPTDCDGDCAEKVAGYILFEFINNANNCTAENTLPPPRQLRLLNKREYTNTIQDLFSVDISAELTEHPAEVRVNGFDNNGQAGIVSEDRVAIYIAAADYIVSETDLTELVDAECAALDSCLYTEIATKVYRRPPTESELATLITLKTQHSADVAFKAMLISPNFLYRSELGEISEGESTYTLSQYEIATLLSYLYWESTPDDILLAAAENGELTSNEQRQNQAIRLLSHDKAIATIAYFSQQWLGTTGIVRATKESPLFTTTLAEAMFNETGDFFANVVLNGSAEYSELFTADYSYLTQPLADFYGVTINAGEQPTSLATTERRGLLGHAGILASYATSGESHPIRRGTFVRETLLCQPLPLPPADVMAEFPELDESATLRERFELHKQAGTSCFDCHQYIDGIGFGFEKFGAIGEYRTEQHSLPIDDSGDLNYLEGLGGEETHSYFNGAAELGSIIAESKSGKRCLSVNYFRYAFGYAESTADQCTISSLSEAFTAGDINIYELLINLTQSPTFITRRAEIAIDDAVSE